jgi:hypothetical protein
MVFPKLNSKDAIERKYLMSWPCFDGEKWRRGKKLIKIEMKISSAVCKAMFLKLFIGKEP